MVGLDMPFEACTELINVNTQATRPPVNISKSGHNAGN